MDVTIAATASPTSRGVVAERTAGRDGARGAAAGAAAGRAVAAAAAPTAAPAAAAAATGAAEAAGAVPPAGEATTRAEADGAVPGGVAGKAGSLIVGAAVGLGGKLIRTVSFFGWTLPDSVGFAGLAPPGRFGKLSAINFPHGKLGLPERSVKPYWVGEIPRIAHTITPE